MNILFDELQDDSSYSQWRLVWWFPWEQIIVILKHRIMFSKKLATVWKASPQKWLLFTLWRTNKIFVPGWYSVPPQLTPRNPSGINKEEGQRRGEERRAAATKEKVKVTILDVSAARRLSPRVYALSRIWRGWNGQHQGVQRQLPPRAVPQDRGRPGDAAGDGGDVQVQQRGDTVNVT